MPVSSRGILFGEFAMSSVTNLVHPKVIARARELGSLVAAIIECHMLLRQAAPPEAGAPAGSEWLDDLVANQGLMPADVDAFLGYPHLNSSALQVISQGPMAKHLKTLVDAVAESYPHPPQYVSLEYSTILPESIVESKSIPKRARARAYMVSPDVRAMAESDFVKFWNAYDKKVGRDKCHDIWMRKMTLADQHAALAAVPAYVASTPEKAYRKNPATWLHNRGWEDEIIDRGTKGGRRPDAIDDGRVVL